MKERLATLISGGGSTMEVIIKAIQSNEINGVEVACVIASKESAGGLQKAKQLGVFDGDIIVVDPRDFRDSSGAIDQDSFGKALLKVLQEKRVSVVTQNGWLPLTPELVINEYEGAIFNQHPGPVPEFGGQGMYGMRVHAARLIYVRSTSRDYWTMAIAQRVHKDYDQGVVVGYRKIDILPEDTPESLQKRLLPEEYAVQIQLLQQYREGTLSEYNLENNILAGPEDQGLLEFAKKAAKRQYPNG